MTEVLTSKKSATPFIAYQQRWMNDDSPRKIAEKSRRTGFSYAEAFDAVSRRFRATNPRNADFWMSSADESSAAEFIEYCRFFALDLFGKVADYFADQVEDPDTKKAATSFVIRCPNGKRITAMTSNPRRFRSKGGDVFLDEFAFHDQPREMYTAAEPCTRWGGQMHIVSTHNGEDSEYNKLIDRSRKVLLGLGYDPKYPPRDLPYEVGLAKARELKRTPYFSLHRVSIVDAVNEGLVERINATRGTTWTHDEFLQDCKDAALDEEAYDQEYGCIPGRSANVLLAYALIEACEHDDCAQPGDGLKGYTGGNAFVGIDVGRTHDKTVVWVDEMVGDVGWCRQIETMEKLPLPEQQQRISAIVRQLRHWRANVDMTGIGLGLFEWLRKEFGESRIEGVQFTAPAKHAMAVAIKQGFEDRAERIPANNGELRDDLHSVRKIVSGGTILYKAPRTVDGHADHFWAKALAKRARGEGVVAWRGEVVASNGQSEADDEEWESERPCAL
jgi:phage FluMu gp28-like protein